MVVGEGGDQVGVVEVALDPGFQAAAAPAPAEVEKVLLEFREDFGLQTALFGFGQIGSIERLKPVAGAVDLLIELVAADEPGLVVHEVRRSSFMGEPAYDAFLGDGVGHGFVEHGFAVSEEPAVGEFVKQQLGEIDIVRVDKGVEDGVVEPTQGGIGGDAAGVDVVAIGAEFFSEFEGVRLLKIAAVVEFSDEWVAPCFRFEGKLFRGMENPDDVVAPEIGIATVAAVARKVEVLGGELADVLDGGEFLAELWIGIRAGDERLAGTAFAKDLRLSGDRLVVEMDGGAGVGDQCGGEQDEEDGEVAVHGGRGGVDSLRSWRIGWAAIRITRVGLLCGLVRNK